ncbi:TPA: hypothetical protein N0F65_011693 [Lagenidium giganteum]|uniref:Anoctamin transmembrane domain-containing protein n=1 Tax=Lagenidium giganteum TaxID=4803 RepID=A0AAV2YTI0_9STRA|nr:TPA: hypothetical protein N0F65_011693 [Lagenidium giganteum]
MARLATRRLPSSQADSGELPQYAATLYAADLVLRFNVERVPSDTSLARYLHLFIGLPPLDDAPVDPVTRVLRTRRCFLCHDGHGVLDDAMSTAEQVEAMAAALQREYEAEMQDTRLDLPPPQRFGVLVAKTVARRIQLACGLTTHMVVSANRRQIVMMVKADDNDLRVEAARLEYRLQVSNRPFDQRVHGTKLQHVEEEITAKYMERSMQHLRRCRPRKRHVLARSVSQKHLHDHQQLGVEPSPAPEMDPMMSGRNHAQLQQALLTWGHNEDADGVFQVSTRTRSRPGWCRKLMGSITSMAYEPTTYFAPYVGYRLERIYQPYYRRYPLTWNNAQEETLFAQKDRIRLAASIIRRHLNIDTLVQEHYLDGDMFALHDAVALEHLRRAWACNWRMVNQPLNDIRFYFGEKIALYFAWLGFYTKSLVLPSLVGIGTHIVLLSAGEDRQLSRRDHGYILVLFSLFVVIWSALGIAVWRRKNTVLNAHWGLYGAHRERRHRSRFRGRLSYNVVTDDDEMTYQHPLKRQCACVFSWMVVLLMVVIVLATNVGMFYAKYLIGQYATDNKESSMFQSAQLLMTAVSLATSVQVFICNLAFRRIARQLNDMENHRTDAEYERQLVLKVFVLQFVNTFASMFYIAFFKAKYEGECFNDDCMEELGDQLLVLFAFCIVAGNIQEVVMPYLWFWWNRCWASPIYGCLKRQHRATPLSDVERQALLLPYEEDASFDDFSEMVVQFGYITLFVVACPLAPTLALVNNVIEVHTDAIKLCSLHRRPFPHSAKTIGAWAPILRFLAHLSFITNTAIILWTSSLFDEHTHLMDDDGMLGQLTFADTTKCLLFVVCVQLCFLMNTVINWAIPTTPIELKQLMQRHKYIANRVFKGLQKGDESRLHEHAEPVDLSIDGCDVWFSRKVSSDATKSTTLINEDCRHQQEPQVAIGC